MSTPHPAPTLETPTPETLRGEWQLRRRLVDRVAGGHGTVAGILTLVADGAGVDWREHGVLRWHGGSVEVTRRYLIRENADGWWVLFEDGRPFHPWRPGSPVEHPCRDDVYRGLISVRGPDRWSVLWDVVGPAKQQRIVTRLSR